MNLSTIDVLNSITLYQYIGEGNHLLHKLLSLIHSLIRFVRSLTIPLTYYHSPLLHPSHSPPTPIPFSFSPPSPLPLLSLSLSSPPPPPSPYSLPSLYGILWNYDTMMYAPTTVRLGMISLIRHYVLSCNYIWHDIYTSTYIHMYSPTSLV